MTETLPNRPSNKTPTYLEELGFHGESIFMQAASEIATELFDVQRRVATSDLTAEAGEELKCKLIERNKEVWGVFAPSNWHPEGTNADRVSHSKAHNRHQTML